MIENNLSNLSSAFEMLLEEVEAEIDFVNGVGAKAFGTRDYEKAKEGLERSGVLTAFRDKVAGLRKEWEELAAVAEREEDEETKAERRNLGRLRRGQRTPEAQFYQPILRILADMGGSGKVGEVLDRLGKVMKPQLKDVDFDALASNPDNLRWRNTAQWARNSMVKEGLLKADSPRGVWEISDRGRASPGSGIKQASSWVPDKKAESRAQAALATKTLDAVPSRTAGDGEGATTSTATVGSAVSSDSSNATETAADEIVDQWIEHWLGVEGPPDKHEAAADLYRRLNEYFRFEGSYVRNSIRKIIKMSNRPTWARRIKKWLREITDH